MAESSAHHGIVVGVDGSPTSTEAVRWAAREAAMRHVGLTLVHSATPLGGNSPTTTWAPIPAEFLSAQQEQSELLIDDAAQTASDSAQGVQIHREVIVSAPIPALVNLSKEAQLIVVGRRGTGRLPRVPLGSVSTAMIHHAHCPVAVIHDEAPAEHEPASSSVVVGIDGSPASELATEIAFDEASRRGVELVAVHASCNSDPSGIHALEWAMAEPRAHETLTKWLAGWQERYPDVRVRRVVILDRPAHHLLEQAESAQLIVVGSHGRGGFAGMLLGSVSTAVVHAAHIPVIVARGLTLAVAAALRD